MNIRCEMSVVERGSCRVRTASCAEGLFWRAVPITQSVWVVMLSGEEVKRAWRGSHILRFSRSTTEFEWNVEKRVQRTIGVVDLLDKLSKQLVSQSRSTTL